MLRRVDPEVAPRPDAVKLTLAEEIEPFGYREIVDW